MYSFLLICKTASEIVIIENMVFVEGDKADFIPRLGRNVEEVVENEKWRKSIPSEIDERSPPFAPRLGRRVSPYSPRLGREV